MIHFLIFLGGIVIGVLCTLRITASVVKRVRSEDSSKAYFAGFNEGIRHEE